MSQKGSLGVRSGGTGHNASCFSQTPSRRDPSWLRGACAPMRKVLRLISQERQSKMIGQKGNKNPGKLPPYKGFKLPKGATPWVRPCIFPHVLCFFNKLFTFLFTFCLLPWIHSWQGRQELRTQALASGLCGLAVRTPSPATKILLPATAAAYCCLRPKSGSLHEIPSSDPSLSTLPPVLLAPHHFR